MDFEAQKVDPGPQKVDSGAGMVQYEGLKPNNRRFVDLMVEGMDQTDAHGRAGFSGDKRAASKMAKRLAPAIQYARDQLSEASRIKAQDILAEIDRQAMFDPGDFMEWGGVYETETGGAGIVKLRPSEDLSPGVRRLITSVSVSAKGTLTVKTVDKQRAQELALKHRGLLRDAAAVDVPAGATVTITVPDNERAG